MNQVDHGRQQGPEWIHGGKHRVIKLFDKHVELLRDYLKILLAQIYLDFILSKICQQWLV